jgi:hypothetical protein
MIRTLGTLTVALASAFAAHAGPFGLEMGTSVADLKKQMPAISTAGSNKFITSTVPKGHEAFETYGLLATPEHGLCKIMAIGRTVVTSVYGTQLKEKFNDVSDALESKYGKPDSDGKHDFLNRGSIWNEPQDWMMALRKKERTLFRYWSGKNLPDNLSTVSIEATAQSTEKGYVIVYYEFSNFAACRQTTKTLTNSSL